MLQLFPPGRVYVFTRSGNAWILSDTLQVFSPQSGAHYGAAVSVSGDNLIVGAPDEDTTALGTGSAYFYRRNTTTGHFVAAFSTSYAQSDAHFGYSVAIGATQALMGAPGGGVGGTPANSGAVFTWQYAQNAWAALPVAIAPSTVSGAGFGSSVALFDPSGGTSATTFAAGAPGYGATGANHLGEVFVFTLGAGGGRRASVCTNRAKPRVMVSARAWRSLRTVCSAAASRGTIRVVPRCRAR